MAGDAPPPEPDRVEGYPHPRDNRSLFGQDRAEEVFLDTWQGAACFTFAIGQLQWAKR